jgi:hypothetical protein
MPIQPAKHKELLNNIHQVQDKLEELSARDLLKDEAFIQLCNINQDLYRKIETALKQLQTIAVIYNERIYRSRWVASYDPNYHRRQVRNQEYRLHHPAGYRKCSCGEFLTHEHFDKHLKTKKHTSSMVRIDIDKKGSTHPILNSCNLPTILVIANQISYYKHGTKNHKYIGRVKKLGMTRMEWLSMFIRRWKIKRM